MNARSWFLPLAAALVLAPCFARADIAIRHVAPDEAQKIHILVHPKLANPDTVYFEVLVSPAETFKNLDRVVLELRDGDKLVLQCPLHIDDRQKSGWLKCELSISREQLDKAHVTIITGPVEGYAGYELKLSEFVDIATLK